MLKASHGIAVALAFLVAASLPASGGTSLQSTDWEIGDLFVGVGIHKSNSGTFRLFRPDGTAKSETLVDAFMSGPGRRRSVTTGCAIAGLDGAALYVTSYAGRQLRRFPQAHPHLQDASSEVHAFSDRFVSSIESIVFDAEGNYYVGAHGPQRMSVSETPHPWGYIYKFDAFDQPLDTDGDPANGVTPYRVPNVENAVDWLDLGADNRTIYYTSESNRIHVFRPSEEPGAAGDYREIVVRERTGQAIGGRVYAVRALPPAAHSREPSGFLAATHAGPIRTDAEGYILYRYHLPNARGTFFAINITPDGKHFWTATYPEIDHRGRPIAGSGGQLFKYNISHVDPVLGPVAASADSGIWGMCMRGEYTAAFNTCYSMDRLGRVVTDATGLPLKVACTVPELCDSGVDEDADGLVDADDSDCAVRSIALPWRMAFR